jgi:GGDEF domain-containing protein
MSAQLEGQAGPEPLSIPMVAEIGERVARLKRKTDFFAHYETFGFALLLLETNTQQAQAFANRLLELITANPVGTGGFGSGTVIARAGVACIPDDCSSLGSLLARARPGAQSGADTADGA